MASGFFLGGMAEGMNSAAEHGIKRDTLAQNLALKTRELNQGDTRLGQDLSLRTRALDITEQGQKHMMQRDLLTRVDQQIASTMSLVSETAQALTDSGHPPAKIASIVQPIIQSAKSLAAKAGRDPSSIDAQLSTLLARPPSPQKLQKVGETGLLGTPQMGFVNERSGVITPPKMVSPENNINLTGEGKTITGVDVQDAPLTEIPTGDAFLKRAVAEKSLSPGDIPLIKGIASGDVDLSKAVGRHKLANVAKVVQAYDPTWNTSIAPARAIARKNFTGSGVEARTFASNDMALQHIDSGLSAVDKLGNTPSSWWNKASAIVKMQTDPKFQEAFKQMQVDAHAVGDELMRTFRGSGVPSEKEAMMWMENFDPYGGPAAVRSAFKEAAKLLMGRTISATQRWNDTMGPQDRREPTQWFSTEGRTALTRAINIDPQTGRLKSKKDEQPIGGASAIPLPPPGFIVTR